MLKGDVKVSIIIVGFNHMFCIADCLDSIANQNYKDIEIIYVDNNSKDHSINFIQSNYKNVIIIKNSFNWGFSKANNQGLQIAKGEFIFFLNPDITLHEDTISILYRFMLSCEEAGMSMPKILMKDNSDIINSMGMSINKFGDIIHFEDGEINYIDENTRAVPCLSGASIFIRRVVLEKIGGFDEDFFAYGEDAELSLRCWRYGYKCCVVPKAEVLHIRNSAAKHSENYYALARYLSHRNKYWNIIIYFPIFIVLKILYNNFLKETLIILKGLVNSVINLSIQVELKARKDFLLELCNLLRKRKQFHFLYKDYVNIFKDNEE